MKKKINQNPVLLVALGGNAMIQKGQTGTVEEQFDNLNGPDEPDRQVVKGLP
jgi:carbamate kinase